MQSEFCKGHELRLWKLLRSVMSVRNLRGTRSDWGMCQPISRRREDRESPQRIRDPISDLEPQPASPAYHVRVTLARGVVRGACGKPGGSIEMNHVLRSSGYETSDTQVVRAKDCTLYTADGRELIDFEAGV